MQRFLVLFWIESSLLLFADRGLEAQPINDGFANAIEFPMLPGFLRIFEITSANLNATLEPGEANNPELANLASGGTLWWKWTAPSYGILEALCGNSDCESVMGGFTGTNVGNLTTVAPFRAATQWSDGVISLVGWVWIQAQPGVTYYLAVSPKIQPGANATRISGTFNFVATPPPLVPPPNDNFADRISLSEMTNRVAGTTVGATLENGEPPNGNHSIWWSWTAPEDGAALIWAEANNFPPALALYYGSSLGQLNDVVPRLDRLNFAGMSGPFLFPVKARDMLQIAVAEPAWGASPGQVTLNIESYLLPPAPLNDNFIGRSPITMGEYQIDVSLASSTFEAGEPNPTFRLSPLPTYSGTVWWSYTAPFDGVLRIRSLFAAADPVLGVYRGEQLAALELITNQFGGVIAFGVSSGDRYQISAAGPNLVLDPFRLSFQTLGPPDNDNFANRVSLEGENLTITGRTVAATSESNEPSVIAGSPGQTVWYSWVAPFTARVSVSASASGLAVYTGPELDRLTKIQMDSYWQRDFLALKDTIYHIQVDGSGNQDFALTISAAPLLRATNDNFADAPPLQGADSSVLNSGSMTGATLEPGEPAHLGNLPAKSIWWNWQAPLNGTFIFNTAGSLISDATLAIYAGPSVEALTLVTKGVGGVGLDAFGGDTYSIAAVAPEAAVGDVLLRLASSFQDLTPHIIPSNLLGDPSFERDALMSGTWQFIQSGGHVNDPGGADGDTWVVLGYGGFGKCWQDIPTVPGRNYQIRFAFNGEYDPPSVRIRVKWNDSVLGDAVVADSPMTYSAMKYWHWTNFTVIATSSVSRLEFDNLEGNAGLDAVSVVWLNEPPSIITQPSSLSGFAGATVSFLVGSRGVQPLSYQWFFNGVFLPGQTQRTLTLTGITSENAGSYYAVVSNVFGTASSASATLEVQTSKNPAIVLQPCGDDVPAGSYFDLNVAAIGTPPLTYQWFFNGEELPGATNRQLVFKSVQPTDAGKYTATVRNYSGSDFGLPARLSVLEMAYPGGTVWLRNWDPFPYPGPNAPIFDVDGQTKLTGTDFAAQLYAGPSLETLRPCGEPSFFQAGFHAGAVYPQLVTIPHVQAGALAYIEVRAWQWSSGASYEEARALGGKFGKSGVLQMATGSDLGNPEFLSGLQSFSLRTGLPQFNIGQLEAAEHNPDETTIWRLRGLAGARYLVEKSEADFNWRPLLLLTNVTGVVTFVDPTEGQNEKEFYRARILD
jgi:hypothetical protein